MCAFSHIILISLTEGGKQMENIAKKDQELARMISEATGKVKAAMARTRAIIDGTQTAAQHIQAIKVDVPKIDLSGAVAAKQKVEAAVAGIPCAIQQMQGIQIDTSNMPKVNIQPIPKFSIPAGYMKPKKNGYQATHIHVEPFND